MRTIACMLLLVASTCAMALPALPNRAEIRVAADFCEKGPNWCLSISVNSAKLPQTKLEKNVLVTYQNNPIYLLSYKSDGPTGLQQWVNPCAEGPLSLAERTDSIACSAIADSDVQKVDLAQELEALRSQNPAEYAKINVKPTHIPTPQFVKNIETFFVQIEGVAGLVFRAAVGDPGIACP